MIDRKTTRFLGFVCAATVANAYYNQPLLGEFARYFGSSAHVAGLIATLCQIGYGIGILLIVPLADVRERRSLILLLLGGVSLALLAAASAMNLAWLYAASLLIGLTTIVPQIIIPYAAGLAEPAQRSTVVGTVQGGLLVGILLARTVSGAIGNWLGWRWVFLLAAALMLVIGWLIHRHLGKQEVRDTSLSYRGLLASMLRFFVEIPALRHSCLSAASSFAAFSAFWTTLAFLVESPAYGYGPAVAGAFGVVGAIGALTAPYAGRLSDLKGTPFTLLLANLLCLAAFGILYFGSLGLLPLLVVGVLVLDTGAQANHIANQSEVFSHCPKAAARLNGVYMFCRFLGGALGSITGSWAWSYGGWHAVCAVGFGFGLITLLANCWPKLSARDVRESAG
ncbi:MAG: transporter [Nevskia sp.]|nr:transporter [Nevskia sp.]